MKIKLHHFILLICLLHLTVYGQNSPKNILFIGNSITYYNDMPTLFKNIANSKGKNVVTQMYAPGGSGFVNHVVDDNVYNLFQNTVWDTVVLQPGSGESAGVSSSVNTTIQRGQILIDSIRKYSPCAKILLYQIPYGVPSSTTYNTYFTIQTQIRDSITKMADNLQIPFIPAGECARMHYTSQQDLLLHNSYNDIHPNLNGSYLIASAVFATLFQEPVTGTSSYGGVTQANAEYFHGIADQIVLPNKPQWRINTFNLHADFNYSVNANTITFTNTSTNYASIEWDFDDGITSIEENPTHTFNSGGIKTIKLKTISNDCEETIEKQIDLGNLTTSDFSKESLYLYPNPAKSNLNIFNSVSSAIRIVNALGQEIYSDSDKKTDRTVNVSSFPSGLYYIIFDNQSVHKFIKN